MQKLITLILFCAFSNAMFAEPPSGKNWKLVFEDNFDYPNAQLDKEWISQNGPSGHIMSSRWRENSVVEDGVLKLIGRKEKKGGQDWTSGNIWTKKLFKYGYYECRYKYASAGGTNNSFWLMTQAWQKLPKDKKRFEIDVNEGHYPDEINMNLHNHSDRWKNEHGIWRHNAWGKTVCLTPDNGSPDNEVRLDTPIVTSKLRISTKEAGMFHIKEIRAFPKSADGKYPSILEKTMPKEFAKIQNFIKGSAIINSSGVHPKHPDRVVKSAIDGNISTGWIVDPTQEEKFIELDLGGEKEIGCVQLLTGWLAPDGRHRNYIHTYKMEYFDGKKWVEFASKIDDRKVETNLSEDFHTYALLWDENFLVYYFDGKEIHRRENDIAHWESPIWLSLAITYGAGNVSDETDGKAMVIDYVKVWQCAESQTVRDRVEGEPLN